MCYAREYLPCHPTFSFYNLLFFHSLPPPPPPFFLLSPTSFLKPLNFPTHICLDFFFFSFSLFYKCEIFPYNLFLSLLHRSWKETFLKWKMSTNFKHKNNYVNILALQLLRNESVIHVFSVCPCFSGNFSPLWRPPVLRSLLSGLTKTKLLS